jgi:uncharacterized protein (UPF0333 family)
MINKQKAQSILEYALFICVVVAALMAMRYYTNRGFQGRLRQNADQVGEGFFYSPGGVSGSYSTNAITNETMVSVSRKPTAEEVADGVALDSDARVMVSTYNITSNRTTDSNESLDTYSEELAKGGPLAHALP